MSTGPTPLNRAFNRVPKRAENGQTDQLRETFVDTGVATVLESVDDQVLYGRRGTGKTHALRYIETTIRDQKDAAVYIDLRTVGSLEGVFAGEEIPAYERAARLLVDIIMVVHDSLLYAATEDDSLISDNDFTTALDQLYESVTSVRLAGDVEQEQEQISSMKKRKGWSWGVTASRSPSLSATAESARSHDVDSRSVERQTGAPQRKLNFSDVASALRFLSKSLKARRVWLLLDEWSSVRQDTQPYLGEFLVRCVTPLSQFVVKIGAIEQQSNFRAELESGEVIGIELGADVSANVNLDDFMVFEQNEERATEFFQGLFFKHLLSEGAQNSNPELRGARDVVRAGFTERRAFQELVRAAEGVPRDAINIAAKAALRASQSKISVDDVRVAGRQWFQSDKESAVRGRPEASRLLNWLVDEVIRGKRARSFLVNQKDVGDQLLSSLFDARLLHVVRRGYSAQDYPGERFDIYAIDYGTYVDLIGTKSEPVRETLFDLPEIYSNDAAAAVEVPAQDLRAIRRTILDLSKFYRKDYSSGRRR